MLYDGARAHTARVSMKLMQDLFEPLQIPVYSCEFNSIEKVWSVAKAYFNKRVLLLNAEYTQRTFEGLV